MKISNCQKMSKNNDITLFFEYEMIIYGIYNESKILLGIRNEWIERYKKNGNPIPTPRVRKVTDI